MGPSGPRRSSRPQWNREHGGGHGGAWAPGPGHLSRGSSELRFRRMSQAKRPIPDNSETRVVRMAQAKRPGPPDFVEDVSALLFLGRS